MHQREVREYSAERVPKSIVCIKKTMFDIAVVGTVVNELVFQRDFMEWAWKQHDAIQRRVERSDFFLVGVFDDNSVERFVPSVFGRTKSVIKGPGPNLALEIQLRLIKADEGRRNFDRNLLAYFLF